jgi:hypothetical protein
LGKARGGSAAKGVLRSRHEFDHWLKVQRPPARAHFVEHSVENAQCQHSADQAGKGWGEAEAAAGAGAAGSAIPCARGGSCDDTLPALLLLPLPLLLLLGLGAPTRWLQLATWPGGDRSDGGAAAR